MDSETAKLKERDEKYNEQVAEWKKSLGPRKKVTDSICYIRFNEAQAFEER